MRVKNIGLIPMGKDEDSKMFVANDKDGNRVYADVSEKHQECFCPGCGERLTLRKGQINRPHFAHRNGSECVYAKDKDSKSPWHIHMQELFPKESREYRFYDNETKKLRYIADVFLEDSNTVIEFQHSPIEREDFIGRTMFHTSEGRRIIWVFDESKEGSEFGRLKGLYNSASNGICFEWPRAPRKVLKEYPIQWGKVYSNYCVCVYLGNVEDIENDEVYRIAELNDDCKQGALFPDPLVLCSGVDCNGFFSNPYRDVRYANRTAYNSAYNVHFRNGSSQRGSKIDYFGKNYSGRKKRR